MVAQELYELKALYAGASQEIEELRRRLALAEQYEDQQKTIDALKRQLLKGAEKSPNSSKRALIAEKSPNSSKRALIAAKEL